MASEKWNDPNHRAETLVIVTPPGGTVTTYGMDKIKSLTTNTSLFGDYYDIGKCVTNSMHASLFDVTAQEIPKMSRVEVVLRIYAEGDTEDTAQLVARGVYYTKRPYYDTESGILEIEGYDEMYKAEMIPYPLGSTVTGWNSETLKTVTQRMASAMGVSIASTSLPLIGTDNFALPPFGYTAREILSDIARAMCGNFIMTSVIVGTPTNPRVNSALKFIPLDQVSGTPTDLGREPQSYSEGDDIEQVGYVIVNYGYDDEGATLSKFSGTEGSGRTVEYTISTITDGSEIQDFADRILAVYQNVSVYEPYSASGCELDPTVEVGEMVSCNGRTAMLGSLTTHFSVAMYSDIDSPSIPEDDDFPCYSQDREIQRNYETEASKIAGTVKFVDLSTPGSTEINGANITTGTITLGGADNLKGELEILDANGDLFGHYDKDGIVIYDDTTGLDYESSRFKIIRKGDVATSEYGVFLGTGQLYEPFYPGTYPNECTPFLQLNGTGDYTSASGGTGSVTVYPNNVTIVDGSNNSVNINANASTNTSAVTRTSGRAIANQYLIKWGRVCQLTLTMQGESTSFNIYSGTSINMFVGTVAEEFRPKVDVMGVGYYDNWCFVGRLQPNGSLTVRLTGYGQGTISGNSIVTFTYLI